MPAPRIASRATSRSASVSASSSASRRCGRSWPRWAIPSAPTRRCSSRARTARARSRRTATQALRASGLRTGRYTSPHLVRVNERITVDGRRDHRRRLRARRARGAGRRGARSWRGACCAAIRPSSRYSRPRPSRTSAASASTWPCSRWASAGGSTPRTSRSPSPRRSSASTSTTRSTSAARSRRSRARKPACCGPSVRRSWARWPLTRGAPSSALARARGARVVEARRGARLVPLRGASPDEPEAFDLRTPGHRYRGVRAAAGRPPARQPAGRDPTARGGPPRGDRGPARARDARGGASRLARTAAAPARASGRSCSTAPTTPRVRARSRRTFGAARPSCWCSARWPTRTCADSPGRSFRSRAGSCSPPRASRAPRRRGRSRAAPESSRRGRATSRASAGRSPSRVAWRAPTGPRRRSWWPAASTWSARCCGSSAPVLAEVGRALDPRPHDVVADPGPLGHRDRPVAA